MKTDKKNVVVVGIGRVGLPLALVLADFGHRVYGLGRSLIKVEQLKKGVMPFIEKGAQFLLKKHVNSSFFPLINYDVIQKADVIILTLGTPIDENMNPVLDQIQTALTMMKPYLRNGQLLILRSTVSPGTTEYVKDFIDEIKNIIVGKNFYLAFCPERIAEGLSIEEIRTIPQIVGGIDKLSTDIAARFFSDLKIPTIKTDHISAELAKLFTNMYRYINFAIANEFMVIAAKYKRDIHAIVDLVNTNYKRGGLAMPGLTAGPCLFKDGLFLINDIPYADLILTSWKINESIPLFLISKIKEILPLAGKKVTILGLAFKPEIDDIRESLSFKVRKAFLRERAKVTLYDSFVSTYAHQAIEKDINIALKGAQLIFIATNHKEFQNLKLSRIKKIVNYDCLVCDIWNVFKTNKIIFNIGSDN